MNIHECHYALMRSGLTKLQIAARLDIRSDYYNRLLKGKHPVSNSFARKMSRVLTERSRELLAHTPRRQEERNTNAANASLLLALSEAR